MVYYRASTQVQPELLEGLTIRSRRALLANLRQAEAVVEQVLQVIIAAPVETQEADAIADDAVQLLL